MLAKLISIGILAALAYPLIWWLYWREDHMGTRTDWRIKREIAKRPSMSARQFYECFYANSEIRPELVARMLELFGDAWEVDPTRIRPEDNYANARNGFALGECIQMMEADFKTTISESQLDSADGSFGSLIQIAHDVDNRNQMAPSLD